MIFLDKGSDMARKDRVSRRSTLKTAGFIGASALLGGGTAFGAEEGIGGSDVRKQIFKKVFETPFIDTHEHLMEEDERLSGRSREVRCDDWSFVLSHYFSSDMAACGMPGEAYQKFFSARTDPLEKWKVLEPWWQALRNTGYGQAVQISFRELYGVDELSEKTVGKVQEGYESTRKKGFYKQILREMAKIESCQVNCLSEPFKESAMPTFLMQDINITGMLQGPDFEQYGKPSGIEVGGLDDWHKVIDWWFNKYGKYAVAAKSLNAYSRDINYKGIAADKVEPLFDKVLERRSLTGPEQKALEDHLFWYSVRKADEYNLPVKLHTGYHAGANYLPLSRICNVPGSASELWYESKDTRFVFMHICYPYYEPMIAVAKMFTNAYIDMCWSWIINPVAAKDFLKKYLVTAPANKIVTFGGDYTPVEPVLGHATIARRGIAVALAELVEEGWVSMDQAMKLTDIIMHENARKIFNLDEKEKILSKVKWS
jgi:predicted TIM-barrel fold metal-dependent hydrolase